MSQSNVNQTLGHGGHFHRSKAGRLQIAARPRGGQTADEEGRCHGGEHGALLLNNQRRLGGTTIASVTSRKPRRLAASRFDCPGFPNNFKDSTGPLEELANHRLSSAAISRGFLPQTVRNAIGKL